MTKYIPALSFLLFSLTANAQQECHVDLAKVHGGVIMCLSKAPLKQTVRAIFGNDQDTLFKLVHFGSSDTFKESKKDCLFVTNPDTKFTKIDVTTYDYDNRRGEIARLKRNGVDWFTFNEALSCVEQNSQTPDSSEPQN